MIRKILNGLMMKKDKPIEFRRYFSKRQTSNEYDSARHLHKCIIPSTWFDYYAMKLASTDIDKLIDQLRDEANWFHDKKELSLLDSFLYDFSSDSNVKKLKSLYKTFFIEFGSEKLMHMAREYRYLSSSDSSIFSTSVVGFRPSTCYNSSYHPSQVERAGTIISTMIKMKFTLEDDALFPTLHTNQVHPQQHKYFLYMIKYFTFPHFIRYRSFGSRYRLFFPTDRYLDMYSRSCIPLMTNRHSLKHNSDIQINRKYEYNEIKQYDKSSHVCVIIRGIIYKINVIGNDFYKGWLSFSKPQQKVYNLNKIVKTLYSIKTDSKKLLNDKLYQSKKPTTSQQNDKAFNLNAIGIGALTVLPRDEWGHLRHHLINLHPINQQNLNDIESAICIICLDGTNKPDIMLPYFLNHDNDKSHSFKYYLCDNVGNRWFDKSTQIVVNDQSNAAILNNLACCDASPSSRLISEVAIIEKFSPFVYESNHPIEPLDFHVLNWVTDNFTENQIKKALNYAYLLNQSIHEDYDNVKLPFYENYSLNYPIAKILISRLLAYSMKKFKKPIRTAFGIYRMCKYSILDFVSLINQPIYNELIKYDGTYSNESDMKKLMELIPERIYNAYIDTYHVSIFDVLIYIAKLNNIDIKHFNDPIFFTHIYNYGIYAGSIMNRHVDFAAMLPPNKDSLVLSFQADTPTRYHIISYNICSGKAKANYIDHHELKKFIQNPYNNL